VNDRRVETPRCCGTMHLREGGQGPQRGPLAVPSRPLGQHLSPPRDGEGEAGFFVEWRRAYFAAVGSAASLGKRSGSQTSRLTGNVGRPVSGDLRN
jgi:hypothetical protein